MTSRDFCYWLQGYFEIVPDEGLSPKQIETVKRHLAMVFKHEIDPSFGSDQSALNDIHSGSSDILFRC